MRKDMMKCVMVAAAFVAGIASASAGDYRKTDTKDVVLDGGAFGKTSDALEMGAVTIGANGGILELGPTATMAFADSSAKAWSGTMLIKGFRDGAVRFGTSAAALTAEQVNMLRAEKPNGRTVHLYITSDGYLALRGMVISIR